MKFSLNIAAPAEHVYAAITTTNGYKGWWAKLCNIDCSIGGVSLVQFIKPDIAEEMVFKTIDAIPGKKLKWLCIANNVFETWVGTTLLFEIEENAPFVTLTFVHESTNGAWAQSPEYDDTKTGWDFFMQSLKEYCETGVGNAWG